MDKQEVLDERIRTGKDISRTEWQTFDRQHRIAFSTEAHEFINEYRTIEDTVIWKYWSQKQTNIERLLDEAVDALHFACLIMNKDAVRNHMTVEQKAAEIISMYTVNYEAALGQDTLDNLDHLAKHSTEADSIIAVIMALLSQAGCTRDQVLKQYDIKNEVNFARQAEGY